jgi:hypothetical protein
LPQCSQGRDSGCAPSDDRESIERNGWAFPYKPVHGSLERVAHMAQGCVSLTGDRCQGRGNPVRQRAPESRTGSAWLGLLYSKVVCVNVFKLEFRGVYKRRHDNTPCPRMLPIRYGGCLLRSKPVRRHWCGVEGGTVLKCQLHHLSKVNMHPDDQKEKLIVFIISRKNINRY